jgi:hypothetical protein
MIFNDTSAAKNGLIQECETWLFGNDYGAISGSTTMLATFTRLLNHGLNEVTTAIMEVDGRWQYDDSNYTDFPVATTTLVDNQQDYQLSASHVKILGVEVKKSDGDYYVIRPLDLQEICRKGLSVTEFFDEKGLPQYYDVTGDSVKLYPAPDATQVTTTAGLKVFFQREPDYFTTDDASRTPGIPSLFHDVPALYACNKYAKSNQMSEKARELDAEIEKRMAVLLRFYSKRNTDQKPRLQARYRSAA